jgi:hypothetical protein
VQSTETWTKDPQGLAWETFLTHGESPVYGDDLDDQGNRVKKYVTKR